MPLNLNIASVFSFIPTDIWRPLKKFVTKDKFIVFDIAFKMSTKYTPGLLMVMMCLSFANQFVRNVEMDCSIASPGGMVVQHPQGRGQGYDAAGGDSELNNFCWNHETFLVAKALDPKMRGMVTYPGVSGYDRGKDGTVNQRYYKYVWLILGILMVTSFLPYFFWNIWAIKKIKPLVEFAGSASVSMEDQRLAYYLDTIGLNGGFGTMYLFFKLLATVSPIVQWIYLCVFVGGRYKYYGVDVLMNFMDETSPWPNPMDALFPKMAKCEWSRYGFGGDMEVKSAQCQLPMNNLTQWSFFVYWWWIAVIFLVNVLSVFKLLLFTCSPCRRYHYRKFVAAACREDVEKARVFTKLSRDSKPKIAKHKKKDVIDINLSFGDWLVLSFVKRNVKDWQFKELVRKIVSSENSVMLVKMPVAIPHIVSSQCQGDEKESMTPHMSSPFQPPRSVDEPDGGQKAVAREIGFIQSVLTANNGNSPPSYSASGSAPKESDKPESTETDRFLPSQYKNAPTNRDEYSNKLTKPVRIDRKPSTNRKSEKDTKRKEHRPPPGMPGKSEPGFRIPTTAPNMPEPGFRVPTNAPTMPEPGFRHPGNMPTMPDPGFRHPGNMPIMPEAYLHPGGIPTMPEAYLNPGGIASLMEAYLQAGIMPGMPANYTEEDWDS